MPNKPAKERWKLTKKHNGKFFIENSEIPFRLPRDFHKEHGNGSVIALLPISGEATFAVIENKTQSGYVIHLTDFRYLPNENVWHSRLKFKIKGRADQLDGLKRSIEKSLDKESGCMGYVYFLNKLSFGGFTEISMPFVRGDVPPKKD